MAEGTGGGLTAPVVSSAVAAPIWGYVATLLVYLLNGLIFHCWIDPAAAAQAASATTAAWTCPMHLPEFAATAIQGLVMGGGTLLTGWLTHRMTL